MEFIIRKIVTSVEEEFYEGFAPIEKPIKRCTCAAVIKNPYAGKNVEDLSAFYDFGEKLGNILTKQAFKALEVNPEQVECYGKGVIVGVDGEREHGAAVLHPQLAKSMRTLLQGGKAIVPSTAKVGVAGVSLDIPLHYKDAAFVASHYDAIEARISDAPLPDEIVVLVAYSTGGRPHARIPGLKKEDAKCEDGLR